MGIFLCLLFAWGGRWVGVYVCVFGLYIGCIIFIKLNLIKRKFRCLYLTKTITSYVGVLIFISRLTAKKHSVSFIDILSV